MAVFVGINLFSRSSTSSVGHDPRQRVHASGRPVADECGNSRAQTTIVVLERHKTFGQLSEKREESDRATTKPPPSAKSWTRFTTSSMSSGSLDRSSDVVTLNYEACGYAEQASGRNRRPARPWRSAIASPRKTASSSTPTTRSSRSRPRKLSADPPPAGRFTRSRSRTRTRSTPTKATSRA